MKICQSCKQGKEFKFFSKNVSKYDGYHTSCKECKNEQQKKWYHKHQAEQVTRVRERTLKYRAANWDKLVEYLLEHPCVDCEENDPIVLEFDHVRGIKTTAVSSLICNDHKWDTIKKEIDKCEIRCRNCHIRKTAKDFNYGKYKALLRINGL